MRVVMYLAGAGSGARWRGGAGSGVTRRRWVGPHGDEGGNAKDLQST